MIYRLHKDKKQQKKGKNIKTIKMTQAASFFTIKKIQSNQITLQKWIFKNNEIKEDKCKIINEIMINDQ